MSRHAIAVPDWNYNSESRAIMKRHVIPALRRVDWSDVTRQNEFLNGVISVMEHLGKPVSYDDLACLSGCAFRGCASLREMTPSLYYVTNDPAIIGHTFAMLGCQVTLYDRSDYATDAQRIIDSIDRGMPVLTFNGVVNCADCCLIAGYDDGGDVLLGYNPFMDVKEDHQEPADVTGYFRKSGWHDGFFREAGGKILIIGEPAAPLSSEETIIASLQMAVRLIRGTASPNTECVTGYAGHTQYAEMVCAETDDAFLLNLMIVCMNCNVYQDKVYAAPFLRKAQAVLTGKGNLLEESATLYDQVAEARQEMAGIVADDLSTGECILDMEIRRRYAQCVYRIRDLEQCAADVLEKI
jgi:hypothetical protein